MRFLCNLLGGLILAVALVFAVADIARALADGAVALTSIGGAAAALGLSFAPDAASGLSPNGIDLVAAVAAWPIAPAFGLLAFLLLFLGRPPHRPRRDRYAR